MAATFSAVKSAAGARSAVRTMFRSLSGWLKPGPPRVVWKRRRRECHRTWRASLARRPGSTLGRIGRALASERAGSRAGSRTDRRRGYWRATVDSLSRPRLLRARQRGATTLSESPPDALNSLRRLRPRAQSAVIFTAGVPLAPGAPNRGGLTRSSPARFCPTSWLHDSFPFPEKPHAARVLRQISTFDAGHVRAQYARAYKCLKRASFAFAFGGARRTVGRTAPKGGAVSAAGLNGQ